MADLDFLRTVGIALAAAPPEFKERVRGVCERTYDTPAAALAALEGLQASLATEAVLRKISLEFLNVVLVSKIECIRAELLLQTGKAPQPLEDDKKRPTDPGTSDSVLPTKRRCQVGLQNHTDAQTTLNKCYLNTCLKGMYLTPGFRQLLEKKEDPVALAVKKIFEYFDSKRGAEKTEVLSYFDERLQALISALAKGHPDIREARQYDATEALSWIVDDKPFIAFEERKERDKEDATSICIPSVDLPSGCTSIFIPIQIPDSKEPVNLQDIFSGRVVTETVDPEAIRTTEYNKGQRRQVEEAIKRLGPTLPTLQTMMLRGEPPPCLLVQLNRPVERLAERAKSMTEQELRAHVDTTVADLTVDELRSLVAQTPPTIRDVVVKFPPVLNVPNEKTEYQYRLCATAIRLGKTEGKEGAGHYFALEATKDTGSWVRHEDESVTPTDVREAQRLNEHDGYILFYTLIR